jgi:hypothetical protein
MLGEKKKLLCYCKMVSIIVQERAVLSFSMFLTYPACSIVVIFYVQLWQEVLSVLYQTQTCQYFGYIHTLFLLHLQSADACERLDTI